MRCRKKRKSWQRKLRKYIFLSLSFLTVLLIYFETEVKIQMTSAIIEELETITQAAINDAVDGFLTEHPDMSEKLLTIHFSNTNSVTALSTDTGYINLTKATITKLSQKNFEKLTAQNSISIPLGGLTGIVFLANAGPEIHLDVDSKQTVKCEFESTFESTGINQTIHHIKLNIYSDITVYNPYRIKEPIRAKTSYEIAQTVIVGTIPSYYGETLRY